MVVCQVNGSNRAGPLRALPTWLSTGLSLSFASLNRAGSRDILMEAMERSSK
jgi:hypothetical protein